MITIALLACFALVGLLSYGAGADDRHRRAWQARQVADQYSAAMQAGRNRHPSRLS